MKKKRFNLKKIISCSEFLSQMPDLSNFQYKIQTGYFYNLKNPGLFFSLFLNKGISDVMDKQILCYFVSNNGHIF